MNTEFTLKNIINLMEAQGFHVREAEEIKTSRLAVDGKGFARYSRQQQIEAIRVVVTPKIEGN